MGVPVERSVERLYFVSGHSTKQPTCLGPNLYDSGEYDHEDQQKVDNAWSSMAKIMNEDDVTGKIYFNCAISHESELNGHIWYV